MYVYGRWVCNQMYVNRTGYCMLYDNDRAHYFRKEEELCMKK